ncbi:MAG: hypothetical protein LWW94_08530 [Candidatus Desulfofervidaceae bacterium]|nr:hypothetical protein [Candidatus Desulfofervidaceae bacterium]
MATIDLRFADLMIREDGFNFRGKRKGVVTGEERVRLEVPAVEEIQFSVMPRKLMEIFANAMLYSRFNSVNSSAAQQKDNQKADGDENQKAARKTFLARLRGKDKNCTCFIGSTRGSSVYISAAQKGEKGVIMAKTSGVIRPAIVLTIIADIFDRIRSTILASQVPFIYPLGVASACMSLRQKEDRQIDQKVFFVFGPDRVEFDLQRRRDLFFILTSYLLNGNYNVYFRNGRMRLAGSKNNITLSFGRESTKLKPVDIITIWAMCGH